MGSNDERMACGLISDRDLSKLKESVCIQTEKIYDSCSGRDCIEDETVWFPSEKIQWLLSKAQSVKCNKAEVVDVSADVQPVPFKRGFYTVEIRFFIKVKLEFVVVKPNGCVKVYCVPGIVTFCKKVILFGSEGNVKIFKSHPIGSKSGSMLQQNNLPFAKIEVADPICLCAKIVECREWKSECCEEIPRHIAEIVDEKADFEDIEVETVKDERHCHVYHKVLATVGLFSIVKLARLVQLLIPAFDFCVPTKPCVASTESDPCELFETIDFPVEEFFPPQKYDFPEAMEEERAIRRGMDS